MPLAIDKARVRMTQEGEIIVPRELWERLLKMAEEAEGWKETTYLLQSEAMRKRLLDARKEGETLSLEAVRERLGI